MSDAKLKEKIKKSWDTFICYPKGPRTRGVKRGSKKFFAIIDESRYSSHPYILKLIKQSNCSGKRVLEVGCGVGSDLIRFAQQGGFVTGIDISPRSIKLAKKNFFLSGVKAVLKVADGENLPFKDNLFDFVYSMGVLHHTPDPQKGVEEIYRVLKPKGRVLVMLYHKNFLTYWVKLFFLRGILQGQLLKRSLEEIRNNLEYQGCPLTKLYTIKKAKQMFLKAGFKSIRSRLFYIHQKNVPLIGQLIPQKFLNILAKRFGFHLVIFATK